MIVYTLAFYNDIYTYIMGVAFLCVYMRYRYENADPLYGCISVTYVATIVFSGSLPMYYLV